MLKEHWHTQSVAEDCRWAESNPCAFACSLINIRPLHLCGPAVLSVQVDECKWCADVHQSNCSSRYFEDPWRSGDQVLRRCHLTDSGCRASEEHFTCAPPVPPPPPPPFVRAFKQFDGRPTETRTGEALTRIIVKDLADGRSVGGQTPASPWMQLEKGEMWAAVISGTGFPGNLSTIDGVYLASFVSAVIGCGILGLACCFRCLRRGRNVESDMRISYPHRVTDGGQKERRRFARMQFIRERMDRCRGRFRRQATYHRAPPMDAAEELEMSSSSTAVRSRRPQPGGAEHSASEHSAPRRGGRAPPMKLRMDYGSGCLRR